MSEAGRHVVTFDESASGERLDRALAAALPALTRSRVKALIESRRVALAGPLNETAQTIEEPSRKVKTGERFIVDIPEPEPAEPVPQARTLDILHEDSDLLVLNKPAGLVVHPGAGQPDGTLLNALLAHAPALSGVPRAGIVHRLDKDTSGLLVVAKTVEAQAALAKQLADRSMRRVYLAVVQGDPPAGGMIDAPLGRDVRSRVRMAVTHRGKPARTAFRVVERFGRAALLECRLETGRTHQIRVHLQHIRHPLLGDSVYRRGTRHGLAFPRQALHAAELTLVHPRTGQSMTWRAPLPRDMKRLLQELRDRG